MYHLKIKEFEDFYSTSLGKIVSKSISEKVRNIWLEIHEEHTEIINLAAIGYPLPYLTPFLYENNLCKKTTFPIAVIPSSYGITGWPIDKQNLSVSALEDTLPFKNESLDRIMIIHALEYTSNQLSFLREVWRVLVPCGKLLVITPNRHSVWVKVENTPFGYGHPFSAHQLEMLLNEAMFSTIKLDKTLFFPPTKSRTILKASNMFEYFGHHASKILPSLPGGGVLMIEAEKHLYACSTERSTWQYGTKKTQICVPATNAEY